MSAVRTPGRKAPVMPFNSSSSWPPPPPAACDHVRVSAVTNTAICFCLAVSEQHDDVLTAGTCLCAVHYKVGVDAERASASHAITSASS